EGGPPGSGLRLAQVVDACFSVGRSPARVRPAEAASVSPSASGTSFMAGSTAGVTGGRPARRDGMPARGRGQCGGAAPPGKPDSRDQFQDGLSGEEKSG